MCGVSKQTFQEAIDHCRWKKVLHNILKDINVVGFANQTFEEIICDIYSICSDVKGIGMLTVYDITAAICRHHKINIDKVYIIGNGPKRAIQLLNIKPKIHKINKQLHIKYVDVNDVVNAFVMNGFELDEIVRNSKNGDILETYICNWQKTK
jgi:hypothetical protein